jgi:diguanylate cyclase (GGDEF)-like protein
LAYRGVRWRNQRDQLVAQADCDGLSGLTSRLRLISHIEEVLRTLEEGEDSGCFLFLLDIDGFKSINDTFGHPAGDEILIAFSQRIRNAIRSVDVAARIGGDEFAVLIRNANLEIAASLGSRLLRAAAEPFDLSIGRVVVTASEGIVQLAPAMSATDVIRDAERTVWPFSSPPCSSGSPLACDLGSSCTVR